MHLRGEGGGRIKDTDVAKKEGKLKVVNFLYGGL